MADQYRRGYEDHHRRQRGDRGWTERAGDEVRTWFGDDEARWRRQRDEQAEYGYPGERGWRDQGDGAYGGRHLGPDRSGYSPRGSYGQGASWQEERFQPHPAGPDDESDPYGGSGNWRARGVRLREEVRRDGEPSWGNSGSYGRSQGAGSFGGGYRADEGYRGGPDYRGPRPDPGPAWSTGGDFGGETSFGPRGGWTGSGAGARQSYSGRGPKDYRRSDERILEDVSDHLERDHGVDASDISVRVQDGEVTFTGTVGSREQKRRAEDCAESVSGVRDVINNLRVARADSRATQASASEVSSSILGIGGQPSRESEAPAAPQASGSASRGEGKPKEGTHGKTTRSGAAPGAPDLTA